MVCCVCVCGFLSSVGLEIYSLELLEANMRTMGFCINIYHIYTHTHRQLVHVNTEIVRIDCGRKIHLMAEPTELVG